MDEFLPALKLLAGLLFAFADHHGNPRRDLQVVRPAAKLDHALLEVAIERLRRRERAARSENNFGELGSEITAGVGRSRLDDDRPSLRRPFNVESALHGEILALVVQRMELLRQEAQARVLVVDKRVILPCIPERLDNLDEFAGLRVTIRMRRQAIEPKIARGVIIG